MRRSRSRGLDANNQLPLLTECRKGLSREKKVQRIGNLESALMGLAGWKKKKGKEEVGRM